MAVVLIETSSSMIEGCVMNIPMLSWKSRVRLQAFDKSTTKRSGDESYALSRFPRAVYAGRGRAVNYEILVIYP